MLKPIMQKLGWNPNGVLLAHLVPFAGDGGFHKFVPYVYTSPSVIKSKFDAMQWSGVDGVIITWQGSTQPLNQQATLQIVQECEKRNMVFALLADPAVYKTWKARGLVSAEAAVVSELTNADGGAMLNSPNYLPEKYFIQFDPSGFNASVVSASIPQLKILQIHHDFSWINSLASYSAVIADFKTQHSSPTMVIPSVWWAFNDAGSVNPAASFANPIRMDANGLDCNTQSWTGDKNPSRVIFDRKGNSFYDIFATVPMSSKYLALGTWDDPNEEPGFEGMCSIMSGIRIQ